METPKFARYVLVMVGKHAYVHTSYRDFLAKFALFGDEAGILARDANKSHPSRLVVLASLARARAAQHHT
jgi:hypothetical protein